MAAVRWGGPRFTGTRRSKSHWGGEQLKVKGFEKGLSPTKTGKGNSGKKPQEESLFVENDTRPGLKRVRKHSWTKKKRGGNYKLWNQINITRGRGKNHWYAKGRETQFQQKPPDRPRENKRDYQDRPSPHLKRGRRTHATQLEDDP